MAEEIDFENGRNSNFEGLVTLTFDRAIRHIVLHQSSTSTYIPNFIQIEETFCGRTDVRADISPLYIIRSTLGSRPNKGCQVSAHMSMENNFSTYSKFQPMLRVVHNISQQMCREHAVQCCAMRLHSHSAVITELRPPKMHR